MPRILSLPVGSSSQMELRRSSTPPPQRKSTTGALAGFINIDIKGIVIYIICQRSILLLKPFGFRIAPDTLSSDEKLVGQRGITPAFGYSAPHPSAAGTLTLLIHALPSAHYGGV